MQNVTTTTQIKLSLLRLSKLDRIFWNLSFDQKLKLLLTSPAVRISLDQTSVPISEIGDTLKWVQLLIITTVSDPS